MKKLTFGVFAALIAASFCQCSCNSSATTFKTLNGVDPVMAGMMIQHFKEIKQYDTAPESETVWFSKEDVHDIISLLEKEKREQKAQGRIDTTDGFRIYFGCDTSIHSFKTRKDSIFKIFLVSTKDNGKCTDSSCGPCRSGRKHLDYYEHSAAADLFKIKSQNGDNPIAGAISTDNCGGGAVLLYQKCSMPCPDDEYCDDSNVHYLKRGACEKMALAFGNRCTQAEIKAGKAVINTTAEWFDLKLLKAFDDEYKNESKYDGIRIYFTRHPDKDGSNYTKRDAFVLVTTKSDDAKPHIHEDYFYCHKRNTSSESSGKSALSVTLNGQDNGELCPLSCN